MDRTALGDINVGCLISGENDAKWSQDFVFVAYADIIQGPEQIIPSLEWLERAKQRPNFLRYILRIPNRRFSEVFLGPRERELAVTRIDLAGSNSDGVSGVIEGFAQVIGGIPGDLADRFRQLHSDLDFMNDFIGEVRIGPRDAEVRATLLERLDSPPEVLYVILCSRKLAV